jgi:capsular exopolysaccharide synthesis family protein
MKTADRAHQPTASVPYAAAEEQHLSDYFRVLYKRRWVALPVFLIITVIGAVNTFRQTPIYQARIQLLIEKDTPSVARLDQMFQTQEGWYNDDFYQTQYRILQSRSIAKRTIDLLKLWDAPRLGVGPAPTGAITPSGLFWGAVNTAITLAKKPFAGDAAAPAPAPAFPAVGETAAQSGRIDEFLGGLSVTPVRNSRLVEIQYTSSDPIFAADAANAVAKAYIEQTMEVKFSASKDAADWLTERLGDQRRAVEASEAALQGYKEKNGTVSITDGASNIVVQRLTDLNAAWTKAKTDRINKEALYNQLKAAEGSGAIDTYPAVLSNDYIQRLKGELTDAQRQQATLAQRYDERHPEMIKARSAVLATDAKLRGELGKIVESVKNEYQAALSQEKSLQSALDAQKGEALSLNRKGIEYGVLQREVESNRQIYESLMQRTKETGISRELRTTNVRVVDSAEVPRSSILPRHDRDIMLATFGGLVLAIGIAFLFEYMDNRIKAPQELRIHLGLAYLGMVPAFSPKGSNILISDDVPASFSESIKSVRTNVLFSSAETGSKAISVTSAGPGEGKSVIAANLAVALAQTGLRVLVIDADMRRPRVHENFGVAQEPGLSNLLVGDCKPSETLRRSPAAANLWILPSGLIPPNPAELLGSKRFEEYLKTLAEQFDWVIIDSPPVLAVADASVVANIASGVIFVVGAEQTTRQAARAAIDQLHAVKAHIIGGVLNRASLDRNPYYYSHYYRKEYVQYYTQSTSQARATKPSRLAQEPVDVPSGRH